MMKLIAAPFTPFKHSSSKCLNLSVIPQYAEYFAKHGIMGILINGTYGEGMTMTTDERIQVANAWSDTVKKTKQQLMIQVGGTNLFDVKKLAAHAQSINADSLLCLPELYYKPKTTEELIDYLKEVGEAAPKVPLYYYHSPAATGVTLKMDEFFLKVGNRVPSLAGIKFAATDLDECTRALSVAGRFKVIVANNYILPAAIVIGVDTFMPTVINVVPELVKQLYDAAISGDFAAAQKHQLEVAKIVDKLGTISEASVLSTMKAVTAYVTKLDLGPTRKPIPSFETPEKMAQVKKLAEGLFS